MNRRRAMLELYNMGFTQFTINYQVVNQTKDNLEQATEILLDERSLAEMFGNRFRELQ